MKANQEYIVLCTCPNQKHATKIAKSLVESAVAACVNIIPNITSIYYWEEKLTTDSECLLLIKTTKAAYNELEQAILAQHAYDCPEIVAMPIEAGSKNYLTWIQNQIGTAI